jgi:ABC-2 type transport system permease protein
VLVAPVPRMAIVLGKVLGGTVLAFGQALLFLLLAPLIGIRAPLAGFALALLFMAVLAFALTALGFCIAWRMTSTQGFHAVMNLFLMPLWFLSGALFPADGAMGGLRWVMRANPLSYGLDGLRQALYWGEPAANAGLPGVATCLAVSVAFAAVLFLLASRIASARSAGDVE